MKYLRISWELLVTSMVFTYPTWTIILPTLWIQSENVDIKMQVRDTHANEHTALKRLGGYFTDRKKGWRCSLDRISKVYRYRHQKTKLKIKFHLYLSDSCHQKIKKYVTWGLKSQKFYVYFLCIPMEPFISGVRPHAQSLNSSLYAWPQNLEAFWACGNKQAKKDKMWSVLSLNIWFLWFCCIYIFYYTFITHVGLVENAFAKFGTTDFFFFLFIPCQINHWWSGSHLRFGSHLYC